MKDEDMIGKKFNRLYVVSRTDKNKNCNVMYLCKCDCGNTIITRGYSLISGHTKSCGCFAKDSASKRFFKHGDSFERLYSIWRDMNFRCANENYKNWARYGGRGIKICDDWKNDYLAFKKWATSNGYEESLTLDRKNNDGNYEPLNCRWVTMKEQANNRSTNRFVEFNGEIKDTKQWAEKIGICAKTLENRLDSGWSIEDALTRPINKKYSHKKQEEN